MKTFSIISLGCPRNLVDSEIMAGSLKKAGFSYMKTEGNTDLCIVNTCAFTSSAREESVDAILEIGRLKKQGKIKCLVIAGCLPQFYKGKLLAELPEADLVIGTSDFPDIARLVVKCGHGKRRLEVSSPLNYIYDDSSPRLFLTPKHYRYIKISEGCSNYCSYCVISRLRGRFRSRKITSIVREVKNLSSGGHLREINIIGQDTTLFGIDQYGKPALPYLLANLCAIEKGPRWIRILYTHPAHYTDELIDVIRSQDRICKYLDLPVQHISDKILKRMNRKTRKSDIINLIHKLRRKIPGISLRTSLIVGFPGESDKDFKELTDFVRQTRFEKLGVFTYSREATSPAYKFKGHIPESVKKQRFDAIMRLQQAISLDINKSLVGKTIDVLIDEKVAGEETSFIGRTEGDAPDIDGVVYVSGNNLKAGEFYKVKVTDAMEYDLVGKAL
ncbi:MAG: 30S ribosomal protein S12 methylthiotransferase RimO [Candidatus Omnitrophica bacterium]|nr:30S ribosomal protein S12 methylthiotransferase RimO [Candidatus Omnitrophota bacterium]MCM8790843.1 30S ribosomal protein S12 methylthiotransferase RimO [Candidatus Omnitrophota bacterium]